MFLFDLNLPRVAAALVAGALFQSLTRNPLASPDLLGVTGGAQLGLLAAMLVPALAGVASVPLLFVCGLAAAACAIVAAGGWRATPWRLVLAGSVCMLLFATLSPLVLAFSSRTSWVPRYGPTAACTSRARPASRSPRAGSAYRWVPGRS